ncbi:MAG: peptidase M15 family protein [Leptolyngbya foveolarum]|uniref:Peptidase M15 family protein n=1 Tax=Leptolyngbya foveolarum TaxID=47253 RepID=A0A2W4UM16_9CYAN|nr:MAG: peptidase M15 family protein [Leptolyngbya foveolarum]
MKVKVVSDTLFKLSPKLSSQLSQSEKVFVKNGTEFEVISYTEAEGNHTRLVLANQTLGNNQRIWYGYNPDIQIESSPVKLRVVSDTLFKERPALSSQLANDEKVFVKNKTEFDLQSYLPAAGNHVKIALANKFLGPNNRNTWYAYQPDVQISGSTIKLKVVSDTLFKLRPVLSSQLSASEKIFVKNGTQFELIESQLAEGNHVRVVLANTGLGDRSYKEWYAYAPDIVVEGNQSDNTPHQSGATPQSVPTSTPPVTSKPTGAFQLPGFNSTFYLSEPIVPNGNFTWAEATKDGSRIPVNRNVTYGIIRIARVMEEVRARLGDRPISINSWYRDPASNRAVGGALYSRHMSGDAIDFVVTGLHSYTVYDQLNSWWGSRGGLASSSIFTHIDARGYYARWSYGY